MRLMRRWLVAAGAAGMLFCYAGGGGAQPVLATGAEAQVTGDGLRRIDPRIMETGFVSPDLDLGQYTKIFFMPTVVTFRDVGRNYNPRNTHVKDFPVSELNRERLRTLFGETFLEYASQLKPYEMSDEVGREILMVQGFLVDVVSGVPPSRPGSNTTFVTRPWEVTVMLEFRDSMSDAILARTMERQRIDGVYDVTEVGKITGQAMHAWSSSLLERMRELVDVGGGRWAGCQTGETDCAL